MLGCVLHHALFRYLLQILLMDAFSDSNLWGHARRKLASLGVAFMLSHKLIPSKHSRAELCTRVKPMPDITQIQLVVCPPPRSYRTNSNIVHDSLKRLIINSKDADT